MGERVCAWCGASLVGKRSHAKYCGDRCSWQGYYAKHATELRDRSAAYGREKRAASPDEVRAKERASRAKTKNRKRDSDEKYRAKNKDKITARRKEYYQMNKAAILSKGRKYAIENPEIGRRSGLKFSRTRAAKLHMQEALQSIPVIFQIIEQAAKEAKQ